MWASSVVQHGLQKSWCVGSGVAVSGLQSTSSTVVAYKLGYSVARGIFLVQGSNLCSLHWQADSLPLSHQGNQQFVWAAIIKYLKLNDLSICLTVLEPRSLRSRVSGGYAPSEIYPMPFF